MCIFATQNSGCILQKMSSEDYVFKKSDVLRVIERTSYISRETIDKHLDILSKPYACYRVWQSREWENQHGPGERISHYSDLQSAVSRKCRNEYGELIGTGCPRFNNARLCEVSGWEFFDPQCPLLKDHSFKLKCGFLYCLRNVVVPREIAYKIRTVSKRRIGCDAAYNIALRLTGKQAVLWWLKMLGSAMVANHEKRVIAGVSGKNFTNTLFGVPNEKGYRYGGAVSKVEKILRHKGFDDAFIRWFCIEAFRLISLDFHKPNFYLEALRKYPAISLCDLEFGVSLMDEDGLWWRWKDKTMSEDSKKVAFS